MATAGGFNIHMTDEHPEVAAAAIKARAAQRTRHASGGQPPATPADDPLLETTSLAVNDRPQPNAWRVAIVMEADDLSVDEVQTAKIRAGLADSTAMVSAAPGGSGTPGRMLVETTVAAEGVLTAILHGLEHVQAATRGAGFTVLDVVQLYAKAHHERVGAEPR